MRPYYDDDEYGIPELPEDWSDCPDWDDALSEEANVTAYETWLEKQVKAENEAKEAAKSKPTVYYSSGQPQSNGYHSYTSYNSDDWQRPLLKGVDREKWRKTWNWLLRFTYSDSYRRDTRNVYNKSEYTNYGYNRSNNM